jgi:Zn-dependent protease
MMGIQLDLNGLSLGRVSLAPEVLFFGAAVLYLGCGEVLKLCLLAAALHELGHILLCILLKIPLYRLRLTLFGAVIEMGERCQQGTEELLVALAGPGANLLTGLAALHLPLPEEQRCLFGGASVMLAVFNLLPVVPLDGSRVLHGCLTLFLDPQQTEKIVGILSHITALALLLPAAIWGIKGNCSLLLVVLWLVLQGAETG